MYADFASNGAAVIARVRNKKPDAYLRIVSALVPKDVNLNHGAGESMVAILKWISEQAAS